MKMLLVGGYCPREDYEDSFLAWFSLLSQAEVVAKQVAREAPMLIVPMKMAHKPRNRALFGA